MIFPRPRIEAALAIAAFFFATPAEADDRVPLTEEEVECNRVQLRELLDRFSVTAPDGALSERVQTLFVTYSNRFGFYEGLVVSGPWSRDDAPLAEGRGVAHLGFHLNPDVRELLLNPKRLPLEQVSMTREPSTSTLVEPDSSSAIELRLRPTLGTEGGPGDLMIDNLAVPSPLVEGFRAADTKPGRGLTVAGLTETCHTKLGDTDRRIFAILQRTLDPVLVEEETLRTYDTRVAIYRGTHPGLYAADVYPVDPESGWLLPFPVQVGISAHIGEDGRLAEGGIALTGWSYLGSIAIVRPVFPGPDAVYEPVATTAPTPLGVVPGTDFDWRDVLDGTAW